MSKRFSNLLFAPPDTALETGGKELTKSETIEILGEDDDDKEVIDLDEKKSKLKDDKEDKEETKEDDNTDEDKEEDEDDELKEIEDELEEPDEEKLELMTPVRRKEILKVYPDLFKKFPYLERAYYREQQFTEMFPTIEDARQSLEKVESFNNIEKELLSGNTTNILKALKEEDNDAFYKLVDNYLPVLADVDEKAYHHVIGNTIRHTIISMLEEAKTSGSQELNEAAVILNQFAFGSSTFTRPGNLSKSESKDTKEEDRISEREKQFNQKQFESSKNDLNTRVNNVIRSTIESHIDPKESMTDYVRKNAVRDAQETLADLIDKDTRFKSLADKLWEKAFESDFSRESVERIRSAYLAKAKTLLPSVIKKARNEGMRGLGKRVKDDTNEVEETKDRKGPIARGRESSHNSSPRNDKERAKQIPAGMKSIDFLMQD